MNQQAKDLIYLASCVLNGAAPDREKVRRMDLDKLYVMAMRHSMGAITSCALQEAGEK